MSSLQSRTAFLDDLRVALQRLSIRGQDSIASEVPGVWSFLTHFNLVKHCNSELAWTLNQNNSLPFDGPWDKE